MRIFSESETHSNSYEPHNVDPESGRPSETGKDVGLDIAVIQRYVETSWIANIIFYCPQTGSTQDILRKIFPEVKSGCVAVTGLQRSGRGRRGAEWVCPVGSVAMSIAVCVPREHPEHLTFLQYLAALSAVDAIRSEPQWRQTNVRIKWPNDVYADGEKIGGVLCEGSFRGDRFHVAVGVGMNITNSRPTTCLRDAVLRSGGAADEKHMREIFTARYLTAFERVFEEFCERGFVGRVRERYLMFWMHSGQVVRLGGPNGPKAVVQGIAPSGAVRVFRHDLQALQELPPDVTSLDLKEGIMKEKVIGPGADRLNANMPTG